MADETTPPTTTSTDFLSMIAASNGGVSPFQQDEPMVYMGVKSREIIGSTPASLGADETAGTVFNKERSPADLLREFERMDREDQRDMAFLLVLGGFAGSVPAEDAAEAASEMTLQEVVSAYDNLIGVAVNRYALGQKVTPNQELAKAIAYRLPGSVNWNGDMNTLDSALDEAKITTFDGLKAKKEKEEEKEDLSGTFTSTDTERNVVRDIMDPNDAMALTRGMLQRELGRDPTKAEFEDFISTIQGAQRANPSVQTSKLTTTQTTDKEGRILDTDQSSTTTNRQGIGAAGLGDVALRQARSNPSWAEWQAVGTYAPALFEALGATVSGR